MTGLAPGARQGAHRLSCGLVQVALQAMRVAYRDQKRHSCMIATAEHPQLPLVAFDADATDGDGRG